jgi:hypothetical protein
MIIIYCPRGRGPIARQSCRLNRYTSAATRVGYASMEHTSRPRGRPRTVDVYPKLIGALGRVGLRLEEVATIVGCSRQHLHSRLCEAPEIREAYEAGRDEWRAMVAAMVETMREARAASA